DESLAELVHGLEEVEQGVEPGVVVADDLGGDGGVVGRGGGGGGGGRGGEVADLEQGGQHGVDLAPEAFADDLLEHGPDVLLGLEVLLAIASLVNLGDDA